MDALVVTATVLYVLAMGLVFGGTAALSFAAAPATFRALPPAMAGRAFGGALRAFDRMASVAATIAVVTGVVRALDRVTAPVVALVVLAAAVLALVTRLRKSVGPKMAALKPPETEDAARLWDPESRRRFDHLHKQYVALYSANLFLSLAGLVLAVLPA
jgi:uncharacterized membrane protein